MYPKTRKKFLTFSHSLCILFSQLFQFSFVISFPLLYIIIKVIYNLSLLFYLGCIYHCFTTIFLLTNFLIEENKLLKSKS